MNKGEKKILARLIVKEIEPIRKLDNELYNDESQRKIWRIIRDVGNAFLDLANNLEEDLDDENCEVKEE